MTFGSRTISVGLPSAKTLPRSSTMARSTSGITISITCSTISTVTPVSRTRRTSSTAFFGRHQVARRHMGARTEAAEFQHLMRLAAGIAHHGVADQRADDDVVDD